MEVRRQASEPWAWTTGIGLIGLLGLCGSANIDWRTPDRQRKLDAWAVVNGVDRQQVGALEAADVYRESVVLDGTHGTRPDLAVSIRSGETRDSGQYRWHFVASADAYRLVGRPMNPHDRTEMDSASGENYRQVGDRWPLLCDGPGR